MMKKYIIYTLVVGLSVLIGSCYKDHTTVDIDKISNIQVEFDIPDGDTFDIEKHDILEIDPVVRQDNETLPLAYSWEVDHVVISTDKKFVFTGEDLGAFKARLQVSNQDGSFYKEFTINVNSPYEEGLLILAEGAQKEGSIGFIRKYANRTLAQTPAEGISQDVFAVNNDGEPLGGEPSDIVQRGTQLYVSSMAEGSILLLNHQTMEVQARITAPEFPDFRPYRLNIPNTTSTSSIILTEDGKLYNIATRENLILKNNVFDSSVSLEPNTHVVGDINFTMNYFWNPQTSTLWNLWYVNSSSLSDLAGQDLVHFFPSNDKTYILTKDKANPSLWRRTVYGAFIQEYFSTPLEILEQENFTVSNPTLDKDVISTVDDRLFKLVYARGNKIYEWYYSGTDIPSAPFITLDVPGEVTSLHRNPDNNELYVGVYDANATGNKGSIMVYNALNGSKIASFANICDKPVRLLYKVKI